MKRSFCTSFLFLVLLISSTCSAQVRMEVNKGENSLKVVLLNRAELESSNLRLRFARNHPSWLTSKGDVVVRSSAWSKGLFEGTSKYSIVEVPFTILDMPTSTEATLELVSANTILGSFSVNLVSSPGGASASLVSNGAAVGLEEIQSEQKASANVPQQYALYQNYPNPFNPTTSIRFDIPQSSWVLLRVYDVLGREVRTLTEGNYETGAHSLQWDGTNSLGQTMPTGVYLYQLSSGDYKSSRRMLLLK